MSVSRTVAGVVERRKDVTRRLGWWTNSRGRRLLWPGDQLTLCPKVQGRRHRDGTLEPLERLAEVEVLDVRREPLTAITDEEIARECVPRCNFEVVYRETNQPAPEEWVRWFCEAMGVRPDVLITRIEWRYLDEAQ